MSFKQAIITSPAHDAAEVHRPPPPVGVVEQTGDEGRQEVGSEQGEDVEAHVGPAVVSKEEIKDGDLAQGFDGGDDDANENTVGHPFAGRA